MIQSFTQEQIAPAREVSLTLGRRVTLVTGEPDTGKSRLLDAIWRLTSGAWPSELNERVHGQHLPWERSGTVPGSLRATTRDHDAAEHVLAAREKEAGGCWEESPASRIPTLYAHANGAISVFGGTRAASMSAYELWAGNRTEIWDDQRPTIRWEGINSMMREVFRKSVDGAATLARALNAGIPERYRESGHTGRSALKTMLQSGAANQCRPSAVGRWTAIAVLLNRLAELAEEDGTREGALILVDDVEAQLHPRWQRDAIEHLIRTSRTSLNKHGYQIVATTTSPIVLASGAAWYDMPCDPDERGEESESSPGLDRLHRLEYEPEGTGLTRAGALDYTRGASYEEWLAGPAIGMAEMTNSPESPE